MSQMRKLAQAGVAVMALGAVTAAGTGTAVADPNNGFRTYSAVGSDTTQAVWNGLTNPANLAAIKQVASYDATPAGTNIQTRAGGPSFLRPTGSGNGVKALSAAWDPANHVWSGTTLSEDDIAFSRSSSGPSVSGSDLTYLPFARDAVSVATDPFGTNPITNLTTSNLTEIYSGVDVPGGVTFPAGLPVLKGHTLNPKLPQSGSGTRNFFLAAIGVTTPAAYVVNGIENGNPIIENDGSYLTNPGDLIPFSAAQWIGQRNGAQADTTTGLFLTSINTKKPFILQSNGDLKPGPLYGTVAGGKYNVVPVPGVGVFNRDTYNVIPSVYLGGSATPAQTTLVNKLTGSATGQLGNAKAVTVIKAFGFGPLGYLGDSSKYLSSAFVH